MGWTGTHKPYGQSFREFLTQEFEWENHKVEDISIVKWKTAYILIHRNEYINKAGETVPELKFCAVVLLSFSPKAYYNLHFKSIDETCGPCESECPERILKAIEQYPPANEWAADWRKRCWDRIKRRRERYKFKVNDIIAFKESMRFTDGVHRQFFIVTKTKPLRFRDEVGYPVRLRQDTINDSREYVLVACGLPLTM